MSVGVMARVWAKSKRRGAALLLTLAIADNANDDGVGWPGIKHLAKKTRMSERQTTRLISDLIQRGEIFREDIRSCRGHPARFFVMTALDRDHIVRILQDPVYFGLDESSCELVWQRVTTCQAKPDIKRERTLGDIYGKKGRHLATGKTAPEAAPADDDPGNGASRNRIQPKENTNAEYNSSITLHQRSVMMGAMGQLRMQIGVATYQNWLKDIALVEIVSTATADTWRLRLPTRYHLEWCQRHLLDSLPAILTQVRGSLDATGGNRAPIECEFFMEGQP